MTALGGPPAVAIPPSRFIMESMRPGAVATAATAAPENENPMESTNLVYHVLAGVSLLILISACSGKLASWINMPYLLLFLGVGMLAGSEGVGGVVFDNPQAANFIGSVAMAFILLSGGFDTEWQSVRKVLSRGTLLSSLGVLLTALFVGVFAWGFLRLFDHEISLTWCFLLGAMVSSTDAAEVFTVLRGRSVSLRGDLRPLLEFESGSNDPMAAFLTVFLVDTADHSR